MSHTAERAIRRSARVLARFGVAALVLASASTAALVPTHEAAAGGPSISVFVGYADSFRAAGEFPNPWNDVPNVTFDGCHPVSACAFDAGAIRVENDNATSVAVDQLSVHIASCLYTWNGPLYPVTLAPGASLVTTQRAPAPAAGCTGPDPSSFDSSDLPSITCSNDGIQPVVDVTVDGTTTSATDTGQVLNTGGIDPATCTNSNESTEWVRIGSKPCPGQQVLDLAPLSQTDPVGTSATVTATFTNACGSPLSGVLVNFKAAAGPNAGKTGSGITDVGGSTTFTYASSVVGTDTLQSTVTNVIGFITASNAATVTWTIEFGPDGGSFVIGNNAAAIGDTVNFWGAQWAKRNSLSGGPAPRSFKGFAESPATPACGVTWTADPGNSTPPPDGPLPALMGVIVTSSAHQTGSSISGDIVAIAIVRTEPGYEPNPGHSGTGTVVAVICGAAHVGRAATLENVHWAPGQPASNPVSAGATPCPTPGAGKRKDCARRTHGR